MTLTDPARLALWERDAYRAVVDRCKATPLLARAKLIIELGRYLVATGASVAIWDRQLDRIKERAERRRAADVPVPTAVP